MKIRIIILLFLVFKSSVKCIASGICNERVIENKSEESKPFLRHTEGCQSAGIYFRALPHFQKVYGGYYLYHINDYMALQLSAGIYPVDINNKPDVLYTFIPSFIYTFHHTDNNHYISVGLEPMIECGSYDEGIFYKSSKNYFDFRLNLVPHYTFYFKQYWAFYAGIGACISFLKNKGSSGILTSFGIQYNF